jgi:hypothetical protein
MAKPRKLKFTLEAPVVVKGSGMQIMPINGASIQIIGQAPQNKVYVAINLPDGGHYLIQDKDLEHFHLNLYKALHK